MDSTVLEGSKPSKPISKKEIIDYLPIKNAEILVADDQVYLLQNPNSFSFSLNGFPKLIKQGWKIAFKLPKSQPTNIHLYLPDSKALLPLKEPPTSTPVRSHNGNSGVASLITTVRSTRPVDITFAFSLSINRHICCRRLHLTRNCAPHATTYACKREVVHAHSCKSLDTYCLCCQKACYCKCNCPCCAKKCTCVCKCYCCLNICNCACACVITAEELSCFLAKSIAGRKLPQNVFIRKASGLFTDKKGIIASTPNLTGWVVASETFEIDFVFSLKQRVETLTLDRSFLSE